MDKWDVAEWMLEKDKALPATVTTYPKIERIQDNYGNTWGAGAVPLCKFPSKLEVGSKLELTLTVSDDNGQPLEYAVARNSLVGQNVQWVAKNKLSIEMDKSMVGEWCAFQVGIKTHQPYHARTYYDDLVEIVYEVLPPRDLFS